MTNNVGAIVLTRGPHAGADTVEIMSEDNSESPFAVWLDIRQLDRVWRSDEREAKHGFALYTQGGEVAMFTRCYLRQAKQLPCLKPAAS